MSGWPLASRGRRTFEGLALDELHDEEGLGDLHEQRLADLEVVASAEIGVAKLPADVEFRLHLFDEADVFLIVAMDVLEGELAAGGGVHDGVDGAARALAQPLQHIVLKEFLAHVMQSTNIFRDGASSGNAEAPERPQVDEQDDNRRLPNAGTLLR